MNRRNFIRSILGLAASSALPANVAGFLQKTAALPDAEFATVATEFYGSIRNVRFYSRALSDSEIADLTR